MSMTINNFKRIDKFDIKDNQVKKEKRYISYTPRYPKSRSNNSKIENNIHLSERLSKCSELSR